MSDFRRILSNAGWNLLGNILPLGAALVAVPFLLGRLGTERFGILSLAWVLIGYFSLFDLGLGRALTKMVAERSETGRDGELAGLCSTGLALVAGIGVIGGLIVAAAIPLGGPWFDDLSPLLSSEARRTLALIALGVPLVVVTAALRGILEGFQRFRLLSAIRVPAGVAMFMAPCASALFSPRLDWAVASIVATRLLVVMAHLVPSQRLVRMTWSGVQRQWITPMLSFGGWLTVSNVVGPVIVYADRFIVGALLSASMLAYYAAPFDVVARLLLFPMALTGALFPALSKAHGLDLAAARELRRRSLVLTLSVVVPLAAVGALAAGPALHMWIGAEFAANSTRVMQILLVGFVFNAAAQIPFAALHSQGCTRQPALLHLIELPIYLGVLVLLVQRYGLEGAACAWALRALFDWAAMTLMLRVVERPSVAVQPTVSAMESATARRASATG